MEDLRAEGYSEDVILEQTVSAAQAQQEGRIWAGGVQKDVTFEEVSDPDLNEQIDDAYRAKYRQYPQYVTPMVQGETRSTTLRLMPRATGA